jgi:carbamate kinase
VSARRSTPPILVAALGGNAIQNPEGDDSVASDFVHAAETMKRLVALVAQGEWRLVITHGNGPQVGNHLLRSEIAFEDANLPLLPLDVCVADTQGGMGYVIQQTLTNALHAAGLPGVVATVVTQVVVDPADPAFAHPSKPVGEMIPADRVDSYRKRGWTLSEDAHRGGWRRVVASPDPKEIVEGEAIRSLVEQGMLVVAAGGGGVPVAPNESGELFGIEAVVDKDLASALLARDIGAEALVILTDVDRVYLGYDTQDERPLERMTVPEARAYLDKGQFPPGSMGPKVEALCRFVGTTERLGLVTSIELLQDALRGEAGTRIVP